MQKTPMGHSKETYMSFKSHSKETYVSVKVISLCESCTRDLCVIQKRPMRHSKEIYMSFKRDLCVMESHIIVRVLHKGPMCNSKETYASFKRDLHVIQKRPMCHEKSYHCASAAQGTYIRLVCQYRSKRLIYIQKRPTYTQKRPINPQSRPQIDTGTRDLHSSLLPE